MQDNQKRSQLSSHDNSTTNQHVEKQKEADGDDFTAGSLEWTKIFDKLKQSFAIVKRQINELSVDARIRFEGFDRYVTRSLIEMDKEKLELLSETVIKEVFTTRIDYFEEDQPHNTNTMYVGSIAVPEAEIVSWAAPLAAALMYERASKQYGQVTRYIIQTKVSYDQLESVKVTYAEASVIHASTNLNWMAGDQYLRDLLASTNRSQLRHIVQTIQTEQYKIISQQSSELEIIQGAPGTGKTSVALHRLAYRMTNNPELNVGNVLFLGPNNVFLGFIKNVLPSLGFINITSISLSDWLKNTTDMPMKEIQGQLFAMQDSTERIEYLHTQTLLVNTTVFNTVDIFIEQLFMTEASNIPTKYPLSFIAEKLLNIVSEFDTKVRTVQKYNPPDNLIQRFRQLEDYANNIARDNISLHTANIPTYSRNAYIFADGVYESAQKKYIDLFTEEVKIQLSEIITNIKSTANAIMRLLESWDSIHDKLEDLLTQLDGSDTKDNKGKITVATRGLNTDIANHLSGVFTSTVAIVYSAVIASIYNNNSHDHSAAHTALLHARKNPRKPQTLNEHLLQHWIQMRFSDVKPIAKQKQMKYVVIDEAQDISPLMLRILRKYMPNAQFSLYGDIAQNIFQDGPSMSWTTMADAFGLPQTVPQYLLTTYRSTKPIMEYAAQVLNRFPIPDYRYANAVMTSDKQPRHIRLASYDELVKYIYQSHQNQPTVSHAVIFKTKQDASYFLEQCLQPHHKKTFAWYDANQLQHPDTIRVIHAAIAKGLEFDVVYLADVDANTYPSDDFHSRVLYVMITRAAKELHVITRTTFSPLINAH